MGRNRNKPKDSAGLLKLFKKSMKEVSQTQGIPLSCLTRETYLNTLSEFGISGLNKKELCFLGGFKTNREKYYPYEASETITKDVLDTNPETEKRNITEKFILVLRDTKRVPTLQEFESLTCIKQSQVKKYFIDIVTLFQVAVQKDPSIKDIIFNEHFFTSEYLKDVRHRIGKHKRLLVTTAVSGKPVNEAFLKSMENYAKRNDALILVLLCEDAASRKNGFKWDLDPKLKDCCVIYKDTYLNSNIYISDIQVSAKQIEPLRGLERFAQTNGSMILASTKQYLKFVANSNVKLPSAQMTTGAVTLSDYSSDFYMSKRTSKIAEFDHIIGALVVEIENDDIFHFRQLQSGIDGSFIDLGVEYEPSGEINQIQDCTVVFGDSHCGAHDLGVHSQLKEIVKAVKSKDIILHDIFNACSITHHDIGKPAIRAAKAIAGMSSLEKEGKLLTEYLEEVGSWIKGKIVIIKSNHDEALDRYLTEMRFINDPINCYFSLELCRKVIEGKDPLRYMVEEVIKISNKIRIKWLERDEDYSVAGIQLSCHGDLGANGSKGSMVGMESAYPKSIVAHSHSAGIHRQVYRVGTSSKLRLDYNRGPSSWTHTCAVVYPNGQRQLINIIKHKDGSMSWRLK